MVSHLLKDGVSVSSFAASFVGQTGPTVRFPDDNELRIAVRTQPLYKTILRSDRIQDLLWELECAMRNKFNVIGERPLELSIEHILPQSWRTHWPLSDGRLVPADKISGADEKMMKSIAEREALIHTLGNLTLMTGPGNYAASNGPFENKRNWLRQTLLALNFEISGCDTWNESTITARAQQLGELAIKVWPAPNRVMAAAE